MKNGLPFAGILPLDQIISKFCYILDAVKQNEEPLDSLGELQEESLRRLDEARRTASELAYEGVEQSAYHAVEMYLREWASYQALTLTITHRSQSGQWPNPNGKKNIESFRNRLEEEYAAFKAHLQRQFLQGARTRMEEEHRQNAEQAIAWYRDYNQDLLGSLREANVDARESLRLAIETARDVKRDAFEVANETRQTVASLTGGINETLTTANRYLQESTPSAVASRRLDWIIWIGLIAGGLFALVYLGMCHLY